MSTHTPGPWAAQPHDLKCWTVVAGAGSSVAHVDLRSEPEITEANARLIAAAPDLLEALKFAEAILEQHVAASCDICGGEGGWEGEGPNARMTPVRHRERCEYLRVRAAITKAEGRP